MRVLLASLSVGAGHYRAAEALSVVFHQQYPEIELKHIDMLDYLNPVYRKIYAGSYLMLVKHSPRLLGMLYKQTAKSSFSSPAAKMRITADYFNSGKFKIFLDAYKPDVVVNTHFLAPELIALLKKRNKTQIPQVVCITDYTAHSFWINPYVDRFYVGADIVKQELINQNVETKRITVTGIPIHPIFSEKSDKRIAQQHFGLNPEIEHILILCGGMGFGNVADLVKLIQNIEIKQSVQLIVVAGKNQKLKAELEQRPEENRYPLKVIGYTTEMHLLLDAVDIVVTKAGGLSISEILTKGLPMVIVDPIPGQEERNTEYLVANHAAVAVKQPADLPLVLANLINDLKQQKELKQNAESLAKPNAATDIVKDIIAKFKI